MEQKYEEVCNTGEMDVPEDYIVLDDASTSHLDLSSLRKRKTKIISSAKETIENGKLMVPELFEEQIMFHSLKKSLHLLHK